MAVKQYLAISLALSRCYVDSRGKAQNASLVMARAKNSVNNIFSNNTDPKCDFPPAVSHHQRPKMSSEEAQDTFDSRRKVINEKREATDKLEEYEVKPDDALLADLDDTKRRKTNTSPGDKAFLEVYLIACRFLAPRSPLQALWLPILFTLLQRYILHSTSNLFGLGSIISFGLVNALYLRGNVYKAAYEGTRYLHEQQQHVSKAKYTVKVAGKRLKNYKSEWQASRDRPLAIG